MHFAATRDLFLTDDRDIVFGLASHHAGIATNALVQVDRHAPSVLVVDLGFLPHRFGRMMEMDLSKGLGRREFVERPFANQTVARDWRSLASLFVFDSEVVLCRSQFVGDAGSKGFHTCQNTVLIPTAERRQIGPDGEDVFGIPSLTADTAGPCSAVAQTDGDRSSA